MMQSSIHFPPLRHGRSVRQTEAVGTGSDPCQPSPWQGSPATFQPHQCHGLSLHPPSSLGCLGSPWGFLPDGGAGAAPCGLPWHRGQFCCSCARGRGCTGLQPGCGEKVCSTG